jgi:uncharacterized Rmd1/YagE family protein
MLLVCLTFGMNRLIRKLRQQSQQLRQRKLLKRLNNKAFKEKQTRLSVCFSFGLIVCTGSPLQEIKLFLLGEVFSKFI